MPWFYSVGGEQKGPVEVAEFESLIDSGVIRPETLVWQPGMPNWQSAAEVRPDRLPPALPGVLTHPPADGGAAQVDSRRYGGFWMRLVARIIDGLVLAIPSVLVLLTCVVLFLGPTLISALFAALSEGTPGIEKLDQVSPFVVIGAILTAVVVNLGLQALYECFMVTRFGATLGKLAMGLTIVTLQGERLRLRQSLLRFGLYQGVTILGVIPLVGILASVYALVDAIVLGTDARKQSLHDRFAKTLVVKK